MALEGTVGQTISERLAAIARLGQQRAARPAPAAIAASAAARANQGGLARLAAANQDLLTRSPELLAVKYQRMDANALAFDRGNASEFYAWQRQARGPHVADGPYTIAAGDMHMDNFGTVEHGRQVGWGASDFDEAYIASPRLDLARLAESVGQAGRGIGLTEKKRMATVAEFAASYRQTLEAIARGDARQQPAPQAIRELMKAPSPQAASAWFDALAPLTDGRRAFARSAKVTSVSPQLAADVRRAFEGYRQGLAPKVRHQLAGYAPGDVVSALAGVGSIGRARYRVMLEAPNRPPMALEFKEEVPAAPAALMPFKSPFGSDAERVVTLSRAAQPGGSPWLGTATLPLADALQSTHFIVRRLTPSKAALDLTRLTPDAFTQVVRYEGHKLAQIHARGATLGLATPQALLQSLGSDQQLASELQDQARRFDASNQQLYKRFHEALKTGPTLA